MFEGLNMSNLGKMFEDVQKKAREIDEKNETIKLTAKSGGGLVKVTANGKGEIIDLEIDDSLLEDKESLQILLISALNDVLNMVEENKKRVALSMISEGFEQFNKGGNNQNL